jgi:N-carbamoyl-L-amino-acid hydrolase
MHIEQGPILEERGIPVGIVSGIRGNLRYRHCRVVGTYDHAGAVPREYRHDAVLAGVELIHGLDRYWDQRQAAGDDFVATVGEFHTDPAMHGVTKVPGELRFTLDIRSLDDKLLVDTDAFLRQQAARIGKARGVEIDLGVHTHAEPALMNPRLRETLEAVAAREGIPALTMASGAGHDCATFTWQGVDTAMLFVRNQHGSHNPHEAMEMADFEAGLKVMVGLLREIAGEA